MYSDSRQKEGKMNLIVVQNSKPKTKNKSSTVLQVDKYDEVLVQRAPYNL